MNPPASILLAVMAPAGCAAPAVAPAAPVPIVVAVGPWSMWASGPQEAAPLEKLYRSGASFDEFLARADRRKPMWVDHYDNGSVSDELVERARLVVGTWRILAVAEDWCSDSVNTIPYLALLTEQVDAVEMRIIDSDAGRDIMEAHRTPDGRAATPTLLVLDESYGAAGCWVERPADLQAWALESRPKLEDNEFLSQKMAWYREDGGESTVSEVLDVIEAAASGATLCGG